MAFQITSPAFDNGGIIPAKYTCDGVGVSVPLKFSDVPDNAKSLAFIMDDPDAPVGSWDHWLLFNLPPTTAGLPEDIKALPSGTREGQNSWRKTGYGGPCPPDRSHRYFFKLYALDTVLELPNGVTKTALTAAMTGHILAQAELVGNYDRVRR